VLGFFFIGYSGVVAQTESKKTEFYLSDIEKKDKIVSNISIEKRSIEKSKADNPKKPKYFLLENDTETRLKFCNVYDESGNFLYENAVVRQYEQQLRDCQTTKKRYQWGFWIASFVVVLLSVREGRRRWKTGS